MCCALSYFFTFLCLFKIISHKNLSINVNLQAFLVEIAFTNIGKSEIDNVEQMEFLVKITKISFVFSKLDNVLYTFFVF